jgi:predicted acylesterase/phospholipase RssA
VAKLRPIAILLLFFSLTGCASYAYTNVRLEAPGGAHDTKATFSIKRDRGAHTRTLGILALSGGGSRAAYFSASVMLALEEVYAAEGLNVLGEIDVISAVSGGALPGAYYAVSYAPGDPSRGLSGRVWDEGTVKDLMSRNYRSKWLWRWFLPTNVARYWFTAFDRSDIMAQVLADNLFDKLISGKDLRFGDINPERPYIVLNAANGTTGGFSERFTFTYEDFTGSLNSEINEYEISRAVMASASYPGAFHYMTLKDFRPPGDGDLKYMHIFDGGVTDNLGLDTIERLLAVNLDNYDRVFIILVDAHTGLHGVSPVDYDPRRSFDYAVNRNLLDSVGSLLEDKRRSSLDEFLEGLEGYRGVACSKDTAGSPSSCIIWSSMT